MPAAVVADAGVAAPLGHDDDPRALRTRAANAVRRIERGFDRAFGEQANPLRQLGGLAFDLFWLIALTGAWLYIFYHASAASQPGPTRSSSSSPRICCANGPTAAIGASAGSPGSPGYRRRG